MFAGTLMRIPAQDEPLPEMFEDHGPALSIEPTQDDLTDRAAVQTGMVAAWNDTTEQEISAGQDGDGVYIETEPVEARERLVTGWVADVTESGLIVPESTAGDGPFDFPADVFYAATSVIPERLAVDVDALYRAWDEAGHLGTPWSRTASIGSSTEVSYGEQAGEGKTPNVGLGFSRPYDTTSVEGIVYASGYIACYDLNVASQFIGFLEDEVLPYTYDPDEEANAQQTLGGGEAGVSD